MTPKSINSFFAGAVFFLCAPFFALAANPGDIVISEIAYDLNGADDGHEWVELFNAAGNAIDLADWRFNDGSNHILNAPPKNGGQGSLLVPAGGFIVLADDAAGFLSDHPGFSGALIDTVMSLNNTADTLAVLDENGAATDTVAYKKEWGAGGNGRTLEKADARGGATADNWKESAQDGGTPGAQNSASATTPPPPSPTPAPVPPPPPPADEPQPAPAPAPVPEPTPSPEPAPVRQQENPPAPTPVAPAAEIQPAPVVSSSPPAIETQESVPAPVSQPKSATKKQAYSAPEPQHEFATVSTTSVPLFTASSTALSARGFSWNIYLAVLSLAVAVFALLKYAVMRRKTVLQEQEYE